MIRLFSTDLDGTLLGDSAGCQRFSRMWHGLPAERRPLLVYNTGWSVSATQARVRAKEMPAPDFIIGSMGTELFDPNGEHNGKFTARFQGGWHLSAVESIISNITPATKQPADNQNGFKSSWIWVRATRHDITALAGRLVGKGISAHVEYSCRYFLDVVPARAGKGNGLAWLCEQLRIPLETVVVAGDTASDASMFLLPGVRGILVSNALAELRVTVIPFPIHLAAAETADGVIEGLQHFGLRA